MDEQTRKSLLAKREEATAKLKQAEADIYFLQGYIRALDEQLEPSVTLDELKSAIGAQSVEVVEGNDHETKDA
jgi:hypothetical protein